MKQIIKYFIALTLLLSAQAYSYEENRLPLPRVYTIYSDSSAPCFKKCPCPMLGLYFDVNVGYSWFNLSPYRPNTFDLLPLGIDDVKESSDSFLAAMGYDFYPCSKIPLRFEINYFYADEDFKINPLFLDTEEGFFSKDRFLVRNTMATLYFDWHTCTRFVPFVGLSAGFVSLKTYHRPNDANETLPFVFSGKENNFTWGGTLGTRYFFTNYLFANLQVRYTNLGSVFFNDFTPEVISPFPQLSNFKSDYFHETTVMLGMGYVF